LAAEPREISLRHGVGARLAGADSADSSNDGL
jgi:hypothetical protein